MLFVGADKELESLPVGENVPVLDTLRDMELVIDILSEFDCGKVAVADLLNVNVFVADNSDDSVFLVLEREVEMPCEALTGWV